ncbi:DUF427 domain-containing protein [Nocardia testacea]|uniref:DUF427 domain-containing protein n=2 Tax=Nocardia testacea TaxID=248551 RepID=A0ABW7VU10_9NOCA|nr:DUF427 domain-containing protein [Nocardia testacea]
MTKAVVNGVVIASSDDTVIVEGNHYFPPDSVRHEFFVPTDTHTFCPWKGRAGYYTVEAGGGPPLTDAAWYYPEPKTRAAEIKDYVAFYADRVDILDD